MTEFLTLIPPEDALARLLSGLNSPLDRRETVDTSTALHRVTCQDVLAPHALPEYARSTVDGFAVRARDTFGASASQPAYLKLLGEIPMGSLPAIGLEIAQCALMYTGGVLPSGADAVVMLENAEASQPAGNGGARNGEVEVLRPVAPGENVISVGEDVAAGQVAVPRGVRLRPQELGALMALGVTSLTVTSKPRVGLISSGDEVVDPGTVPLPGQVRDVNAFSLSGMVSEAGGEAIRFGVVPDEPTMARTVAQAALFECDMVVITAGSSASTRDLTAATISSLGPPGVLVHGVNIRPGKPTILGVCDGKAVIGLPGNPVSALVIARLFVVPVIERLLGRAGTTPSATLLARLAVNLPSQTGREDWWPVRLMQNPAPEGGWVAEPVFGRSNLIFTMVAANGMLRIAPESGGLSAGEAVEVHLF